MYSSLQGFDVDMHGDGLDSVGRPSKRSRGWQQQAEMEQEQHQQHQQHMHHSAAESSNSRSQRMDAPPAKHPDKERGRLLSCRECRRLKLKCDRVFPCQSCRKRGCADICPEGLLTSGRGSRFILANTAELHDRIAQLADRVRQLEDGLELLQSTMTPEPHPLLASDLLRIKNVQPSQPLPPSPHSNIRDDGIGASSSSRQQGPPMDYSMERPNLIPYGAMALQPDINIPSDIMHFSVAFPFPWNVDVNVRRRIRDCLPPRPDAQELCEQACHNALWQYNLNPADSFLTNLLHHCYSLPIEDVSPRRLALLLMILSIGSHVNLKQPIGANVLHGEAYHHLARAAVCEIPLMDEPDFDELHALFFMVWYHLVFSDNKKAVGYAWNLLGFVVKLAQGLGLHRDGRKMKVIPEEDDRRRSIFWELLNLDCRLSLSLGRPPSISLAHVDARRPDYEGQGLSVSRQEVLYHKWKNGFYYDCLSPILESMTSITLLDYDSVMALDNKVRNYAIPPLLDEHGLVGSQLLAMQRAFVATSRHIAILQLHRRYFTDAMNNSRELFSFNHKYAPSVVATYLGASHLISTVEAVFDKEADLSARFLCFWFNAFSAAVTLSLLVSRAPQSSLATFALKDLDRVRKLFMHVATVLPFCGKALPLLEKVASKSMNLHMQVRKGQKEEDLESLMEGDSRNMSLKLPESFSKAHSSICQYAEQIMAAPSIPESTSRVFVSHLLQTAVNNESEMWLPEVYNFTSAGVGPEDRHSFKVAAPHPTPFSPMDPRVGKHESVNFDHGAITVDLTDTSYMAWF